MTASRREEERSRDTMRWSLEQVAQALGVAPPAETSAAVRLAGVSIDSRTIAPGELFFAIRGPRHDGHRFVAQVLAAGTPAAVVERSRLGEFPADLRDRILGVEDTQAALGRLAQAVRRAWGDPGKRRMAAVTGSTGKTTTKEILAALLGSQMAVLKSEGNLNNAYGLPLTLCRLEEKHCAAVVELGMSRQGELTALAKIAEPEVGVVTNVSPAHLEFFSSVDQIALAKRELIENLAGAEPVAVLNADDPRVARFAEGFRGKVITYGREKPADIRAQSVEDRGLDGSAFECVWKGGRARLALPLAGSHNVMNALGALAAASLWGISPEQARGVFPRLVPVRHRSQRVRFREGFTVLDDSYNSNPAALAAMIDWLAGTTGFERRILAAGEMLELGPASASLHREAGRWAAGRVDWILGVQGDAKEIVRGAIEAGHDVNRAKFFDDAIQAAQLLQEILREGDLVVLKGSRGVRMERILDALGESHDLLDAESAGRRERR
jgi:UDP-N-acetylmuramoyl-tripeptide--D-alanyl-D-alanine ligase